MKKKCRALGTTMLTVVMATGLMVPVHAAVENGWRKEGRNAYWYEGGVKQGTEGRGKEIYDPDSNAWYWLDAVDGGCMAKNKDVFQESKADDEGNIGKWVRYDNEGHMIKGWSITDAGTYYFDPVYGTMAKGYKQIEGVQYYFNEGTGIMVPESCSMRMDNHWETIDGKQYWYEGGIRQGYNPVDASYRGKEIYDPGTDAWYWLDNVQQGAKAVSKDVYQESESGKKKKGKWVRYDAEGHMVKGWSKNGDGVYYFDPTYGTMAKGKITIENRDNGKLEYSYYYFNDDSGILEKEFDVSGNVKREYDTNGNVVGSYVSSSDDHASYLNCYAGDYYTGTGIPVKRISYEKSNRNKMTGCREYECNENGKIIKETDYDMDGKVTGWGEYQYDGNGNEIKWTSYNAEGQVIDFKEQHYDEKGELIKIVRPGYEDQYQYEGKRVRNSFKRAWFNSEGTMYVWQLISYDEKNGLETGRSIYYGPDGKPAKHFPGAY